jgi:hypothetical protein
VLETGSGVGGGVETIRTGADVGFSATEEGAAELGTTTGADEGGRGALDGMETTREVLGGTGISASPDWVGMTTGMADDDETAPTVTVTFSVAVTTMVSGPHTGATLLTSRGRREFPGTPEGRVA